MSCSNSLVCVLLICFGVGSLPAVSRSAEQAEFAEILLLAGLDPSSWPAFDSESIEESAKEVVQQLLFRLREASPRQRTDWSTTLTADSAKGTLVAVAGSASKFKPVAELRSAATDSGLETLYRVHFELPDGTEGSVLSPRVPSHWQLNESNDEPIRFIGILLRPGDESFAGPVLLTSHLSWYPTKNVSSGMLLLAQQGMDVALFDDVKHRQTWVKPGINREADAFYDCLVAMAQVDQNELASTTLKSIEEMADDWETEIPALEARVKALSKNSSVDSKTARQQLKSARQRLAMAAAVVEKGEQRLTSVAPLFLQPEQETGHLVRIVGHARRALRIVGDGQAVNEYFEVDVFTSDSQHIPITCCVSQLPDGFPQGDAIYEKVSVDGIFFKLLRYRTRENIVDGGKTVGPRQGYTPVIVGKKPIWLKDLEQSYNRWSIAAGICFIAVLFFACIWQVWSARQDRRRRAALYSIELPDARQQSPTEADDN